MFRIYDMRSSLNGIILHFLCGYYSYQVMLNYTQVLLWVHSPARSICNDPVLDTHKAVCCDMCNLWVHVDCDASLSDELYDQLLTTPSSAPWFCFVCCSSVHNATSCSHRRHSGLSSLCLNARSILTKHYNLFALMCTFNVDVLTITETFLDSSISDSEICPHNYTIFCKDQTHHGGGVLIIVQDQLKILYRDMT